MAELATTLQPASDEDRLLAAEALVRAYCRWHIAPVREDVLECSAYDNIVVLPTLRLVEVVSVVDSDGVVLDPLAYSASPSGVLRLPAPDYWVRPGYLTDAWARTWGDFTVRFRHGYEQPPADVTAAVQAVALQAKANAKGLQSKTAGPYSETYATSLLGVHREALAHHRLPARP